ncbi:hypothetical protein OF83DRAFT_218489, partial [Amylostereum chailletii]
MSYLASLPTPQAKKCPTFCPPPLHAPHPMTVPELYTFHSTQSPDHPLFMYADGPGQPRTIPHSEAHRAIRRAARIASGHCKRLETRYAEQRATKDGAEPPVVGLLSNSDTITICTTLVGIMHAGLTPFPISTRNSAVGVAHLIAKTGILQLFVSPDPAMQRLSQ